MKNMKKTKKFLLDEESTNEEILDEEFLEEESLDEKETEEEPLEENKKDRKNTSENIERKSQIQENIFILVMLVVLALGGYLIFGFFSSCDAKLQYQETTCDWCGKTEDCKIYTVYFKNGYNYDGSVKVDTDCMWFSDKCLDKAKNSPYWLKID